MLIGLPGGSRAQAEPEIDLLTLEPGDSLWERFGHTALRVRQGPQDLVISFGAAPFRRPSFVWAFVRGRGDFYVVSRPFPEMLERYRGYNRTLQSQRLLLSPAGKAALVRRLNQYLVPPNNHYRYDQLYDNCATRIRDLLDDVSGGALKRAARQHHPKESFRTLSLYAGSGSWIGSIGFDLISGPHLDPPVTGWEEMFLPLALRDRVAEAQLPYGPMAAPAVTLLTRVGPPACTGDLYGARRALLALAGLALLATAIATRKRVAGSAWARRAAAVLLSASLLWSSAMGLLIVPMMLLSRVQVLNDNENGWLFWPFDLLWLGLVWRFAQGRPRVSKLALGYWLVRVSAVAVVVALKLSGVLAQRNGVFVSMAALMLAAVGVVALHARRVGMAEQGAPKPQDVPARAPPPLAPHPRPAATGRSRGGARARKRASASRP